MSELPQSPFLSADQNPLSAEKPVAAAVASPPVAATELILDPPSNEWRHQGAPAVDLNPVDAGATDHIHEIFHHVRKIYEDEHRFILDEAAFMAEIEPPPLFLQRATG